MDDYINILSSVNPNNTNISQKLEHYTSITEINNDSFFYDSQNNLEDPTNVVFEKTKEIVLNKNEDDAFFYSESGLLSDEFFDTEIKLSGYIRNIDVINKKFIVLMHSDEDNYEREVLLSFSDVDKNDVDKIVVGARIVYVYGKQYIHGTAYNSSKIIFRAQTTWNKYKLKKLSEETKILLSMFKTDAVT